MYTLKVNDEQLKVILAALDFYSRCGCGQIEDVCSLLTQDGSQIDVMESREFFEFKKLLTGFAPYTSHSVVSPQVKQCFKEAYSIFKQIRKFLWRQTADKPKWSVDADGDTFGLGKQPPLQITDIDD